MSKFIAVAKTALCALSLACCDQACPPSSASHSPAWVKLLYKEPRPGEYTQYCQWFSHEQLPSEWNVLPDFQADGGPERLRDRFIAQGHVALRGVIPGWEQSEMKEMLTRCYNEIYAGHTWVDSGQQDSFDRIFNLWEKSLLTRAVTLSRRFAFIASTLLGTDVVRLYQDSIFWKKPHDISTSWHVDAASAPFSAHRRLLTMWCPLKDEDVATGALMYANASHIGPFDLINTLDNRSTSNKDTFEDGFVKEHYEIVAGGPRDSGSYNFGDCSFHTGLTMHRGGANSGNTPRVGVTVSYVPGDSKIYSRRELQRRGQGGLLGVDDGESIARWMKDLVKQRTRRIAHPLLPVVWNQTAMLLESTEGKCGSVW